MSDDPRLSAIEQIAIAVGDVDVALGFYRDVLGLEFLFRAGVDLAFLDAGGTRIMLTTPQGAGAVGANSILYFKVADIVATHAALVRRGATNERAPQLAPGCRTTNCGPGSCGTPTATWSAPWRRSDEALSLGTARSAVAMNWHRRVALRSAAGEAAIEFQGSSRANIVLGGRVVPNLRARLARLVP